MDRKGLLALLGVLASLIVLDQFVAQRFTVKATTPPPASAFPPTAGGKPCGCAR